jgi:predicted RNase H-like nuclease (RuvC/YqgF family)
MSSTEEYVKELELENWTHKREIAKLRSDMEKLHKSNERIRRSSGITHDELKRTQADKVALQKELFESHKQIDKLEEQVEVLKRANEINEKQIRDYERDQVDVKRVHLDMTTPIHESGGYNGTIYGIAMR